MKSSNNLRLFVFMFLCLFLLSISYTVLVYGFIEVNILSVETYSYFYREYFYYRPRQGYAVFDYDHDGRIEMVVPLCNVKSDKYPGMLLVLDPYSEEYIEEMLLLENFLPIDVLKIDKYIVVTGFFVNMSRYGVLIFSEELSLVRYSYLSKDITFNYSELTHIRGRPLFFNNRIYYTIVEINGSKLVSHLVTYDLENNELRVILSLNNTYLHVQPRNLDDKMLLWGFIVLDTISEQIIHNLSEFLDESLFENALYIEIHNVVYKKYIIYYVTFFNKDGNYTSYFIIYDKKTFSIIDTRQATSHVLFYDIVVYNNLYSIMIGSPVTIGGSFDVELYLLYDLVNFINTSILSFKTSTLGIGVSSQYLYLLCENKLYILDTSNNDLGVTIIPNNISYLNQLVDMYIPNDNEILILDADKLIYLKLELSKINITVLSENKLTPIFLTLSLILYIYILKKIKNR